MATQRNHYSAEFKAKIALEVLKEQQTLAELGSCYGVHPTLVAQWKRQLRDGLPQLFRDPRQKPDRSAEEIQAQLYQQIGQLKVELDWLKKKRAWSVDQKRAAVEPDHPELSVARQCELLDLGRSSYYYRPVEVSAEELRLLRWLDEQYTRTPFYGVRRMTAVLRHEGYAVNPKRVRRLLRKLGLWALVPQPGTSRPAPEHRVYPYLLWGVAIERVNQVWSTDNGYWSPKIAAWAKERLGLTLLARRRDKKGEPPSFWQATLDHVRKPIEGMISVLTECFGIEHLLAKTEIGLYRRMQAKATAFTLGRYINRVLNLEPLNLARYAV